MTSEPIDSKQRVLRRFIAVVVVCCLSWMPVAAHAATSGEAPANEPVPTQPTKRARNRAGVETLLEQHRSQYQDDANMMIRPGLLANRADKSVRIWAEAVGLNPMDPVEFFLISDRSGKDYEALAVSFARPLDIHEALEFIGMKAGRPVDYDKMQMWPKAERVLMTFEWTEPDESGAPLQRRARAEELIIDSRTGTHLPLMGMAFTGSIWIPSEEEPDQKLLAADGYDPHAIASAYNERLSLLDIPRKAVDGEVYGYQKAHPDLPLPSGALIQIVLRPEYTDGKQRLVDLDLAVQTRKNTGSSLRDMTFSLSHPDGAVAARGTKLKNMLAAFARLTKQGHDPFVRILPDTSLPLSGVRELYAFLAGIATDEGIRIEPPAQDQLFYKAFLPNERFRKREDRPTQPWELHLYPGEGSATGVLVRIQERWEPDTLDPELQMTEFGLDDPKALQRLVQKYEVNVPVLLVFAPGAVTYGDLLSFVGPVLSDFPTVYVFLPVEDTAD